MLKPINCHFPELILYDRTMAFGPKMGSAPVCLHCMKPIRNLEHLCSSCQWPFCSDKCALTLTHKAECSILARNRTKVFQFLLCNDCHLIHQKTSLSNDPFTARRRFNPTMCIVFFLIAKFLGFRESARLLSLYCSSPVSPSSRFRAKVLSTIPISHGS